MATDSSLKFCRQLYWSFDLDGIAEMYRSYEAHSLWGFLQKPADGIHVSFVRAEHSTFRWAGQVTTFLTTMHNNHKGWNFFSGRIQLLIECDMLDWLRQGGKSVVFLQNVAFVKVKRRLMCAAVGGKKYVFSLQMLMQDQELIAALGHRIYFLHDAGHWVHTDNPEGLFAIMSPTFGIPELHTQSGQA